MSKKVVKKKGGGKQSVSKKKSSMGLVLGTSVVLILVVLGFVLFSGDSLKVPQAEMDVFAKCLTESETVMYGTFWCPHCAKTKKMFAESFKYINYVECDPRGDDERAEFCIEKGIDKYDTWEFSDGSRVIGEPSLATLGEKAGCTVPGGN